MPIDKGAYVLDSEGGEIGVEHLLLKARYDYLVQQLGYLATFVEKAGYALEAKSKLKEYPEAAGIGAGALSGAYAFVRSMTPETRPATPHPFNLDGVTADD